MSSVRDPGGGAWPVAVRGAGPADLGDADGVGDRASPLAVSGVVVRRGNLVRAHRRGRAPGVVDGTGRSRDVLRSWLDDRGELWCARIQLATLDPAAGYRAALIEHLANATLVVDHFHGIKLANKAIDDVRRRVQNDTLGHRGQKHDPLYRARRVMLAGYERLSADRFEWLQEMLAAGDPDGEVGAAILAKELLREVWCAMDEAHARRRLIVFFQYCAEADVPELLRLARTIDRWSDEVLAYHRTDGASNGRVENVHMLAEKIRRNAHGFTNHINYRRRLIGRLGIKWATVPTRRIRGHQPRSVA